MTHPVIAVYARTVNGRWRLAGHAQLELPRLLSAHDDLRDAMATLPEVTNGVAHLSWLADGEPRSELIDIVRVGTIASWQGSPEGVASSSSGRARLPPGTCRPAPVTTASGACSFRGPRSAAASRMPRRARLSLPVAGAIAVDLVVWAGATRMTSGSDVPLWLPIVVTIAAPAAEDAVVRTVQESLTNALKHAGPGTRCAVLLAWIDSALHVTVESHPQRLRTPHRAADVPGGWSGEHGLAGLAERAALAGGRLNAGPAGGGFSVKLTVPARAVVPR